MNKIHIMITTKEIYDVIFEYEQNLKKYTYDVGTVEIFDYLYEKENNIYVYPILDKHNNFLIDVINKIKHHCINMLEFDSGIPYNTNKKINSFIDYMQLLEFNVSTILSNLPSNESIPFIEIKTYSNILTPRKIYILYFNFIKTEETSVDGVIHLFKTNNRIVRSKLKKFGFK